MSNVLDVLKSMTEGTATAGGHLVPEILSRKILALVQEKAKLPKLCMQVKMTSDTLYIPSVTAGSTAYWVGEIGTITASDLTFGRVTLTAKKVAALSQFSTELEEDSISSVMDIVFNQIAKDLALKIDDEILNGTGGQFSNYWTYTSMTNVNTVAASGADGDAMAIDKVSDAIYEIRADNHNATHILCHPRVTRDFRNLTDTTGQPIFNEFNFGHPLLEEGVIGTIYGLKLIEHSSISLTQTKGSGTTLTDVIVITKGESGVFGMRRTLKTHKFYVIETDSWKVQSNIRCAFNVPYPKSMCIIQDIT